MITEKVLDKINSTLIFYLKTSSHDISCITGYEVVFDKSNSNIVITGCFITDDSKKLQFTIILLEDYEVKSITTKVCSDNEDLDFKSNTELENNIQIGLASGALAWVVGSFSIILCMDVITNPLIRVLLYPFIGIVTMWSIMFFSGSCTKKSNKNNGGVQK